LKILGIETSSVLFSVCLCDDTRLVHEIMKDRELLPGARDAGIFQEAERLLIMLPGRRPDAVAVSIGPGMFTALRVGVSLAKGICHAHGVPLVSINTLDCIGADSTACGGILCAVINAYKGELYAAFYERDQRISDHLLTTPRELRALVRKQHARGRKQQKVCIGGPGINILKSSGIAFETPYSRLLPAGTFLPSAYKIACLAVDRINAGQFDAVESLEPYYLKKTDAERNAFPSGRTPRRRA
jgi:tRNA threonylcarbamoyladenosine biosynthesis protein TsaB